MSGRKETLAVIWRMMALISLLMSFSDLFDVLNTTGRGICLKLRYLETHMPASELHCGPGHDVRVTLHMPASELHCGPGNDVRVT